MSVFTKRPTVFRAYSRWMSGTVRLAVLGLLLLMQPGSALGQTDAEIETVFWESVECESVRQVELYLEIYPTGRYVAEAHECLEGQLGLERAARILVQQGLRALEYEVGAADGLFGPATRAALRQWQAGKEFAGTGYLTREQAEALVAAGHQAVEEEEARQRQRAEAARREREQEQQRMQEAARRQQEQRAEAQRREQEQQRAQEAARRAECKTEVVDWTALPSSDPPGSLPNWPQISACLTTCAQNTPLPTCDAERTELDRERNYNPQGNMADLTLDILTLGGWSAADAHIAAQELQEAQKALEKCLAPVPEAKNRMSRCMIDCCAEM